MEALSRRPMFSDRINIPIPRILALATAAPPFDLDQNEVARSAGALFAPSMGDFDRLTPVYRNAEIERRHSCVPLDWYLQDHSFAERNNLFLSNAVDLLVEAAARALDEAGLQPADIDMLVTVCSSGIATPSLDARLMQKLSFRADVMRLPIFGLGCVGGVIGLARAAALARSDPGCRVLLLDVELCGLTFRHKDRSKSNVIATALFGDGAAAAVIACSEMDAAAPRIGPAAEHTWPDSLDVMGWDIANDGLKVIFSGNIPNLVRSNLRPVVDHFLHRNGTGIDEVDGFICHPGGAKVLDALEECFNLPSGALVHPRTVLRRHGNMSSATVLFVLREALDRKEEGVQLLTALGPGFTAGMMLVET